MSEKIYKDKKTTFLWRRKIKVGTFIDTINFFFFLIKNVDNLNRRFH